MNGDIQSSTVLYLETLRRIAMGMGPHRGFHASLQSLLALLAERHGFLRPHLVIFDPETRTLRLCVTENTPRSGQVVYEPGVGVTGQVFVSGQSVIVERLKDHPVFLNKFFARTEDELASLAFLSVPILAPPAVGEMAEGQARRVIGVLSVDTRQASRDILEMYRNFLEVVASMIAAQAAYLQDDMARQQRMSERAGKHSLPEDDSLSMIAQSPRMQAVLKQAACVARGRSPVLLYGETGTGRARLAALIHAAGPRHDMPMVRFRVATDTGKTLSEEGMERELFGYRKGAFSGAVQTRKGLFELAHCSTLFFDGVDALSPRLQARLLQLLQEKRVTRIGGGQPLDVDVRLIFATTVDLASLSRQGLFLEDLYNRISPVCITIPPLRERPEDIPPLAECFLYRYAESCGRAVQRIAAPAREILCRYAWPGNIRELAQCIEQAVQVGHGPVLEADHLPPAVQEVRRSLPFTEAVACFEQELLRDALQQTRGNMFQAAKKLQVSYRIFNYKVKKYGLDPHNSARIIPLQGQQ